MPYSPPPGYGPPPQGPAPGWQPGVQFQQPGPYGGQQPPGPAGGAPAGQHYSGGPGGGPKPKGGARRVWGGLLIAFGILPLLAGVLVIGKAVSNAQQTIDNGAFLPAAWHNLRVTEIFPDHIGEHPELVNNFPGRDTWYRAGIAEETTCAEGFRGPFLDEVSHTDCTALLRATYVDMSGTVAATVAIAVMDRPGIEALLDYHSQGGWDLGAIMHAYPVEDTGAATWSDDQAIASGLTPVYSDDGDQGYLIAATVGPLDGRAVARLPSEWSISEDNEVEPFFGLADLVAWNVQGKFEHAMEEES